MDIRKLLLAGVATTAFAGYAAAQTAAPQQPGAQPPAAQSGPATPGATSSQSSANAETDAQANEPRFANYKGADVVDREDNSIATISDVLIDDSGKAKHLVLSEGGVMGVGATYRAFEISSLPALAEGDVKLDLTKESLAALPEYTYPEAEAETASAPATAPGGTASGGTAGSTAPSTSTAAAPTAPAGGATEGRAATATPMSPEMAALWPVSALVGAEIESGDKQGEGSATTVSDFRFSADGKVEQVVLNKGGVLGVGGEEQTVQFSELSISGTPDEPVIALSGGASGATSEPKSETERAPASGGATGTGGSSMPPASSPATPR
jgi:hypothetical protein